MFRKKQKQNSEYEILELLGEGLTSCVYKAIRKHPSLGIEQVVALKVFKSDRQVQTLKNEIQILNKIESAHCVRCLGWARVNDQEAIVLEYLDGVSLYDYFLYGSITQQHIDEVIAQIQEGLRDLHREHVLHGDLSPKNIFITVDGRAKLLDFGFSGSADFIELNCTPQYLSIEGWRREKLTMKSDLFSLGLLQFDLLNGELTPKNEAVALKERATSLLDKNELLREQPMERTFLNLISKPLLREQLALGVKCIQQKKRTQSYTTRMIFDLVCSNNYVLPKFRVFKTLSIFTILFFSQILQPAVSASREPTISTKKMSLDLRSRNWSSISLYQKVQSRWVYLQSKYTPVQFKKLSPGDYQVRWRGPKKSGIIFVQLDKNRRILIE